MLGLIIKQRAAEMAKEAYEWYEEQSPGLGDTFLDELSIAIKKSNEILRIIVSLKADTGALS